MTKPKLKEGMKFVDNSHHDLQVPVSVSIAPDAILGWNCNRIGDDCVISELVELDTSVGDNVRIGTKTVINGGKVGNNIRIGSHSVIQDTTIADGVTIGHNVSIGYRCTIRTGVNIPDYWLIPDRCIVNPGPDGFPVVIVPPPTFHCNLPPLRSGNY